MSVTEYDDEGCPACGRELFWGCCLECGTPYNRIVEKGEKVSSEDYKGEGKKDYASALAENPSEL